MTKHCTKSHRKKSLRRAERVARAYRHAERRKRTGERPRVDGATVRTFVEGTFGTELHAGTTLSLSNAVVGAVQAGELAIHLIGAGLATAQDGDPKHATKQVDRLLSNAKVDVWDLFDPWVKFVVGSREDALVALDWTDYARDGHTTIAANLVTGHGRATPLVWKTVPKAEVTDGARNDFEDELLLRLKQVMPEGVRVTVVADRGFGDTKLYEFLDRESWGFVIRFRECIHVRVRGERKTAGEWVPENGRPKLFRNVEVTSRDHALAGFVAVRDPGMKDAWCLATNRTDLTARELVQMYGRRFTIEETFRDQKDPRFGLGLEGTRIKSPARRDRLLLVAALAQALLTLLGAASERCGYDKKLKVNTVKKRTHSLHRQGCYWFGALPNMSDERAAPLLRAFESVVREHALFRGLFGVL